MVAKAVLLMLEAVLVDLDTVLVEAVLMKSVLMEELKLKAQRLLLELIMTATLPVVVKEEMPMAEMVASQSAITVKVNSRLQSLQSLKSK